MSQQDRSSRVNLCIARWHHLLGVFRDSTRDDKDSDRDLSWHLSRLENLER
jgi:hypothetical protein